MSIAVELGGDDYHSTSVVFADIGDEEMLDCTVYFHALFCERKLENTVISQAT